ncbi:MAG: amidophosphoribosyltransferase [Oscillospiraceae bacterium]|jgi:amidophosphoribosyltransferase|nr:amidophosphoribosyltransferase [Oscillospiraceae bacterium]
MHYADDRLHEECGLFGKVCRGQSAESVMDVYAALFALQHRGQHSAGIASVCGERIHYKKGDGLVGEVFDQSALESLPDGHMAIGHVRYAPQLGTSGVNAQPLVIHHKNKYMALAFNGSLTNADVLKTEIEAHGGIFQTTGDAEIILYIIVREMLHSDSVEEAVLRTVKVLKGAFTVLLLTPEKLIALRDPHGFRPLCVGRIGADTVVASESCALDAIGAAFVRDIRAGEVYVIDAEGERVYQGGAKAREALCVFEYIYFARPDSVIDGLSVEHSRQEAGRRLARRDREDNMWGEDAVVIGVPDTGLPAAQGYALESRLPFITGLTRNRYIGRTFIQSTQEGRERAVNLKLNAMRTAVKGKSVIMLDDSIVRGTTIGRIVSILLEAGASKVHLRVASPPFLYPCHFGTDIPERDRLIANRHTIEQIREKFGLESLKYLCLEDLDDIMKAVPHGVCGACFTGKYPTNGS